MHNKVILLGNLGQDPEMRYLADGTAVTNISVATNRTWKNEAGEQMKETIWVRCSVWGKSAEVVNEHFEKGQAIYLEGRLKPDPQTGGPKLYERKDGTMGASYEITVTEWRFVSGGEAGERSQSQGQQHPQEEDEIPF